ncbi:MAG: hypothetical protein HY526_10490 [Betaproteobacteria bacterium]|nr:hypothetical protein [Betaproteobacteria bacterium]
MKKWFLAALLLLVPCMSGAAGLGRLAVLSSVGQPLRAEIDLVSVQKEELASLSVRLASPEAYRQANLQYNSVVAGLRFSIEKRPNGQPYIQVSTTRPVNEFVLDILVELNWASGRLMREYTALLDPPGAEPAAAPVAAPAPPPGIAPQPAVAAPPVSRPIAAAAGSYGPIERGETLGKIARTLRTEGVTLEQMLVGLFRSNPDAFIRKNMNLVRSGKILRVPDKDEVAAIPQREAVKEYRSQVADWNSYRRKLADAAGIASEGRAAASGRITARVEEKTTAPAKDVVRLSKGEPPGAAAGAAKDGKPLSAKERIRNLEEEVIAKERALQEANERVVQLEKTIKDMQRLVEIKSAGMAAAQQQAEAKAGAPEIKPEAQKPAPQPAEKPMAVAKSEQPKPKAKPAPPPPPPPEPELMDIVMDNLPLVGGGAAIILGGVGLWLMRRRRAESGAAVEPQITAPTLGTDSPPAPAAAQSPAPAAVALANVDPLEEARVYLAHGRDAQAEATLKEAIARDPGRHDTQLKLLEIYASRKDKAAFAKQATEFRKISGEQAESWLKVVAMGAALDPENPLFSSGRDAPAQTQGAEGQPVDLDFNLDLAVPPETTDVPLDVGAPETPAEPPAPSAAEARTEVVAEAKTPEPVEEAGSMDFHIELPEISAPESKTETAGTKAGAQPGGEPDFKLDLGDINLSLDDKPKDAAESGGTKDAQWYDVQAKFDLAKAYQEMGHKADARNILEEVVREGDAEQQAQAKALLRDLS